MGTERKILLTGSSGFLGSKLAGKLSSEGDDVLGTVFSSGLSADKGSREIRLDLADTARVEKVVAGFRPDTVIHTAYKQNDSNITDLGTRRLVDACLKLDKIPYFILMSSDLVFDGCRGNYSEEDTAAPLIQYGRDKLAAEDYLRQSFAEKTSAVVRTSLIYDSERIPSHLGFAVKAIERGEPVSFFNDEWRSPVYLSDLMDALSGMIKINWRGTVHLAGPDRVNRHEFGSALLSTMGYSGYRLEPGSIAESNMSRPADCSLDISLAARELNYSPLSVFDTLKETFKKK